MKEIFAKLFGKAGGGIVDSIGGVVDKFVQTSDEKAAFEKEDNPCVGFIFFA